MRIEIMTIVAIVIAMATVTPFASVSASHSADPIACEGDGIYDGKNNPFSQEFYKMCGEPYYQGFIEGCMSIEGNTREACEMATDAGNGNSTESVILRKQEPKPKSASPE